MTAHELLQFLIDRGKTQKQISAETGIKQPTISRVLSGSQSDIPFSLGKRLEAVCNNLRGTGKKAA